MSVPIWKRQDSKVLYIYKAYEIYKFVIDFMVKLSAKYSRILATNITTIAFDLCDACEKAEVYACSKEMRDRELLRARGSLESLDVQMSIVYELLLRNPAAAMNVKDGSKARNKLDNMAQKLGDLLNEERELLSSFE